MSTPAPYKPVYNTYAGFNPQQYLDDASSQHLASLFGGRVVTTNPAGPNAPPPQNGIDFGAGWIGNAGLTQALLDSFGGDPNNPAFQRAMADMAKVSNSPGALRYGDLSYNNARNTDMIQQSVIPSSWGVQGAGNANSAAPPPNPGARLPGAPVVPPGGTGFPGFPGGGGFPGMTPNPGAGGGAGNGLPGGFTPFNFGPGSSSSSTEVKFGNEAGFFNPNPLSGVLGANINGGNNPFGTQVPGNLFGNPNVPAAPFVTNSSPAPGNAGGTPDQ